jgi:hypothetical protein
MFLPFIIWVAIFVIAYTQSPLFTSNQNQYFLHGIAAAGEGFLSADLLVNTFDPTPLFSGLVQVITLYLHPWLFYLLAACLIGLYFWLLVLIVTSVRTHQRSRAEQALFLSLIILIHSAAWRFAISRLFGPNWSYLLEDGLADQRLLGPVLQPSMFGVLLLLSILLFLKKRPFLAVVASGFAATVHPTYLLSAAALTMAYLISLFLSDIPTGSNPLSRFHFKKPLLVGLCAFVVVLPIVTYAYLTFGSTPVETSSEARRILISYRIPHHVAPEVWFDSTAIIKLGIIAAATWIARKTRLFLLLAVPALIGLVFSLVYVFTRNDILGLIFPWRLSTFLVPISSAIIIDWLLQAAFRLSWMQSKRVQRWFLVLAYTLAGAAALVGVTRLVLDFQRQRDAPEQALFTFVKNHLQPGQVVLTPVKMQEFRLATGSPVYVDFKSIPYRDLDVLEWYRRIQLADDFYKDPACEILSSLIGSETITHVVMPGGKLDGDCEFLSQEFRTPEYEYYSINNFK